MLNINDLVPAGYKAEYVGSSINVAVDPESGVATSQRVENGITLNGEFYRLVKIGPRKECFHDLVFTPLHEGEGVTIQCGGFVAYFNWEEDRGELVYVPSEGTALGYPINDLNELLGFLADFGFFADSVPTYNYYTREWNVGLFCYFDYAAAEYGDSGEWD